MMTKQTTKRIWVAGAVACLCFAAAVSAEPEGEVGLLKRGAKVDKPIADTYEPLNSTYVGDGERLNDSIEQSWSLKRGIGGIGDRRPAVTGTGEADSAERESLEQRIQEPGQSGPVQPEPSVETTDDSLSIREP